MVNYKRYFLVVAAFFVSIVPAYALSLKIDIGDLGQVVKSGWQEYSGDHNNDTGPFIYDVDGHLIVVGIAVGGGVSGYRDYGGGSLGGDMVYPDSGTGPVNGTVLLTLDGLPEGDYTLTSYHNDTKTGHSQQEAIDITVSGAVTGWVGDYAVTQTKSLDDSGLGSSTVSFTASGSGNVTITYTPTTDSGEISKAVLNGFEIDDASGQIILVGFQTDSSELFETGGSADIAVGLSTASYQVVTVDYNVCGGTAENGEDYILSAGTLVFDINDLEQNITISVQADLVEEVDETVLICLSSPSGAEFSSITEHTFTILSPKESLCPAGDIDGDCDVDANDILLMSQQWLDWQMCSGLGCANIDQISAVDLADFTMLAGNWQKSIFPVVINEILASNDSIYEDPEETGEFPDWIELYNASSLPIELGGMYLTDDLNEPGKWRIPNDISIGAFDYMLFLADDDDEQGDFHTNFKLSAGGEIAALFDIDETTLLDFIAFEDQITDISYGRYPDASSEIRFFAEPTPLQANSEAYLGAVGDTKFSVDRGFYDTPFDVIISCNTPGSQIHYTLDGSEPTETVGGSTMLYTTVPILVTDTTTLRAAAYKAGYIPSNVDTQTYIFLDDVITQTDIDQGVVSGYGTDSFKNALKSLPSLSIVNGGLYGATSVELIYADPCDGEGFQENCEISPHSHIRDKQAYRLEFKNEYGAARLDYPFFESDPVNADLAVDVFDRIVLRSASNMPMNYIGDPWTAQSQIDMSGIGVHNNFVHLYLNGQYRGVYNPKERPDAWFTSSYFGGDFDDYFATNHGIERCCGMGCPIIIDSPCNLSGDDTRFNEMMLRAYEQDLADSAKYSQFKELCDANEFVDYTILFWYSGFGDNMDNNWYAGMRNVPQIGEYPPERFMMFMWDAEYVFLNKGGPPGNEEPWVPYYYFDAGWMISDVWLALFDNPDFRMLFADRVYKHCFHDGALTDDNSQQRWSDIAGYVDEALICEKARWGYSEDAVYVDMTGNVNTFIDALRGWSDAAYPDIKLYPDIDPSEFSQHGGPVSAGYNLILTNPNASGTIYYTFDGSDPRQPVTGDIAGIEYTGPVTINAAITVKTRVFDASQWSALNQATFTIMP